MEAKNWKKRRLLTHCARFLIIKSVFNFIIFKLQLSVSSKEICKGFRYSPLPVLITYPLEGSCGIT